MLKFVKYCVIYLLLYLVSCEDELPQKPTLNLSAESAPFELLDETARFYSDVSYGEEHRNVFDIFLPSSSSATPIAIFFHGGGFTGGDKSENYLSSSFQQIINQLLLQNIAFASVNYQLLDLNDKDGVLKPLHDSKRALQFIRYFASELNINKNQVVLLGSSAGAGKWSDKINLLIKVL